MTGHFFAFLLMAGISLLPWVIIVLVLAKAREVWRRK